MQTVAAEVTDASGNLWIATLDVDVAAPPSILISSQSITQGDAVTFTLQPPGSTSYASVQWDFNYDGSNFIADPTASGTSATTTLNAVGNFEVAAQDHRLEREHPNLHWGVRRGNGLFDPKRQPDSHARQPRHV